MPLKKGAAVRQTLPQPISGEVIDAVYDADTGEFRYLVRWTEADGRESSRWFTENEVQEVTA